jgi:hypothetical protein
MQLHMTKGSALPLIVDDYFCEDISPNAFDPFVTLHDSEHVHPTAMLVQYAYDQYIKNGFLVRPNEDGAIYCITWRQFHKACRPGMTLAQKQTALDALEPKKYNGVANTWIECPVVKVFGSTGDGAGHYLAEAATEINVGIIL